MNFNCKYLPSKYNTERLEFVVITYNQKDAKTVEGMREFLHFNKIKTCQLFDHINLERKPTVGVIEVNGDSAEKIIKKMRGSYPLSYELFWFLVHTFSYPFYLLIKLLERINETYLRH